MTRRRRHDAPGRRYHAYNRGQDRREIFRRYEDYRFFLCLLALAVRSGRIAVHAYCLMPNHYHLLIESLTGELSETMRWIQSRYAAYYNHVYGHTGHVFESRFHSIRVTTWIYLFALICYIHRNPVLAGRCDDPRAYEYSSARWHALGKPRPRWLARALVDEFLAEASRPGESRADACLRLFDLRSPIDRARRLIKARLAGSFRQEDALDQLCLADDATWVAWFRALHRRSPRADAILPMADVRSLLEAHRERDEDGAALPCRSATGQRLNLWGAAAAGLLHDLAGMTRPRIARILRVSVTVVSRRMRAHREAVRTKPVYAILVAQVARRAMHLCLGRNATSVRAVVSTEGVSDGA